MRVDEVACDDVACDDVACDNHQALSRGGVQPDLGARGGLVETAG